MNSDCIQIVRICPLCGERHTVTVKQTDFDKWIDGELAQRAFPYLTPSEREIIMTGICDNCFPK